MTFPLTLENLPNNIQPTDKVSVRDHAKLHNDVARVVNALQTKMGVDFSSDHNTLDWMIRNMGPGGGSNVIRVSPPQNHTIGNVATFVHDLGLTQADIESGRYEIKFIYKVTTTPAVGVDSGGNDTITGTSQVVMQKRDAGDPITANIIHHQADSLKVLSSTWSDNIQMLRCIIIDNNIVGGGILPPWTTTYQTSFLVVDSLGNAITDAVITFNGVTNNAGDYTFNTLLGNFSYSCDKPGYITASGDVLIDGVSTHTIVLTATGAGMYNLTFDISSDVLGSLTDAIVTLNGVTYPVGQMIFNMPDDTYNYTVNRLGHDPVMGSVVVAGADVTEVVAMTALPPLYTATFYIEDNVGTPILDARIEFEGNTYPASYYDFITNAGTYNYTVHRLGYTSVSGTLVLSGNTTITITMDPNAALHAVDFTVEDNVGIPVAGASINLNGIQFSAGQYSFNLPTGTYTYIVSKSGYYSAGSFVVVSGPTIENVVLTALPTPPTTYTVTFDVEDSLGAPITDAIVTFDGVTNPAGDYVFAGIPAGGPYNRSVDKAGYTTGTGSTSVTGNTLIPVVMTVYTGNHNVTFDLKGNAGDEVSNFRIKFDGTFGEIDQVVFPSIANGTYNYEVWTADMSTQIEDYNGGNQYDPINHDCEGTIIVAGADITQRCRLGIGTTLYATSASPYDTSEMPRSSGFNSTISSLWSGRGVSFRGSLSPTELWSTGSTGFTTAVSPTSTTVYWKETTFSNGIKTKSYITYEITAASNYQVKFTSTTYGAYIYQRGIRILLNGVWLDVGKGSTQMPNGSYNYEVWDAGRLNYLGNGTFIVNGSNVVVDISLYVDPVNITYTPNSIPSLTPTSVVFTAHLPARGIMKKGSEAFTGGGTTIYTPTWTKIANISTPTYSQCDIRLVGGYKYNGLVLVTPYTVPRTVTFDVRDKTYTALSSGFKIQFNGVMGALNQTTFTGILDGQYNYALYESDGITPILDMPVEGGTTGETWAVNNFSYLGRDPGNPLVRWTAASSWIISGSQQIINQGNPTPHELLQTHYNRDYRNGYGTPTYWQYLDYKDWLINVIANWRVSRGSPAGVLNVSGDTTKLIQLGMR